MSAWVALLVGAGAVVCISAFVDMHRGFSTRRGHWSPLRIGLGLAITLATMAAGGALVSVKAEDAPEQLGIAAVVHGIDGSPARGFDVGLFVSSHVRVDGCDRPVRVRLTLDPTAEFWIDQSRRLKEGARVEFGIPDDGLEDVVVLRGEEASVPLPATQADDTQEPIESVTTRTVDGLTVVSVEVPRWGRTLDDLTVSFSAPWTQERSRLGGCYVRLPALTGLPTVLTAARVLGLAGREEAPEPEEGAGSLFVVSSTSPEWHAYYNPDWEVTRGVMTLDTADYTLDDSLSQPAPTTDIQGAPAWTCRSSIVGAIDFLGALPPDSPAQDYVVTGDGEGVFGGEWIDDVTDQSSCGAFVVLDDPGHGTRRDLLLILVGALFSFGIELLLSGMRRRDRDVAEAPS